jgi:hypothetical protein
MPVVVDFGFSITAIHKNILSLFSNEGQDKYVYESGGKTHASLGRGIKAAYQP